MVKISWVKVAGIVGTFIGFAAILTLAFLAVFNVIDKGAAMDWAIFISAFIGTTFGAAWAIKKKGL